MPLAALLFAGRDWLWPASALFTVCFIVLVWSYRRTPLAGPHRIAAALLKTLGVAALGLCLLEPHWSSTRARPGANLFAILADNSQGMQIHDRGESKSRADALRELVTDNDAAWQVQLAEFFDVRRYLFDSRLQQTKDFAELDFTGRSSSLVTALKGISERLEGRPLAGVLVISDGNATDVGDGAPETTGLPPIYPVVIGSDYPSKDLALQSVTVSQTSFEDAPVTIQAAAAAYGYDGARIVAQLFDESGKKVAEQTEKARRDGDAIPFRFMTRPDRNGIQFYRLQLSAREEAALPDGQTSAEATLANNSRMVVVDRGRGAHRILYVAGRPNWEFKFLRRALEEDTQVHMSALIRLAKREPKFDFRGRPGESSNPLFRGFDKKTEETERYDQPVLTRLNIRDESELRGGFPKTAEELYAYEAVIVDDLEAEFFTHDQMVLLQKFVSERGGGFLMLGGQESFQQGKFDRTPIGDMLPVYLDRPPAARPMTNFRLDLTREGWLQPWARLRSNEGDERKRLESMPPFQVLNPVRDIKPGASAIAMVADSSANRFPAIVAQRFGHGRTAALMLGDLWRWGMQSEEHQKDLAKAWRQMARWLIADVPQPIDMVAQQQRDAHESVSLRVRVRDKKFQPLENASVVIEVRSAGFQVKKDGVATNAPSIRLTAEPVLNEPGVYQATYVPRETGAYRADAFVTDPSGVEMGRAEVGWTADPAAEEFKSLKPNRALLDKIAHQTGGSVVAMNQLKSFTEKLPRRSAPITETWTFPIWHTPLMFLVTLACFVGEWGLRRWKGVA